MLARRGDSRPLPRFKFKPGAHTLLERERKKRGAPGPFDSRPVDRQFDLIPFRLFQQHQFQSQINPAPYLPRPRAMASASRAAFTAMGTLCTRTAAAPSAMARALATEVPRSRFDGSASSQIYCFLGVFRM